MTSSRRREASAPVARHRPGVLASPQVLDNWIVRVDDNVDADPQSPMLHVDRPTTRNSLLKRTKRNTLRAIRFPQLYAAASLKPCPAAAGYRCAARFPQLYAAASLKLAAAIDPADDPPRFPQLYAAASLKRRRELQGLDAPPGFPQLYAAASLKPCPAAAGYRCAARFPQLYAAASLKLEGAQHHPRHQHVFRSYMLRPH